MIGRAKQVTAGRPTQLSQGSPVQSAMAVRAPPSFSGVAPTMEFRTFPL
jgi:hypothetical protein